MINELAKIIDMIEILESDPAAKSLQKRGLELYRTNKMMTLKAAIDPRYFEGDHYDSYTNARSETQEFDAISYLFGACINFQDKNYRGAIKTASNALAIFRQTSREVTLNEGLALCFRGILYRLDNDNRSAIDDFQEAKRFFQDRAREFEFQKNYNKKFYCLDLIPKIAVHVSSTVFSEIISRLRIPPEDSELYNWWVEIQKTEPFNLEAIDENIESLKTVLASEGQRRPFDFIFLAHCYNVGFYTREGPLEYQDYALLTFRGEFDDISNMGGYNQALSHMYLAFLYYNIFDVKNGQKHLNEANDLLKRLLVGNTDANIREIQSLQKSLQIWINQLENEIRDRYSEVPKDQVTQHPRVGIKEKVSTTVAAVKSLFDTTSAPEETPPAPNKVYGSNLPSIPELKNKKTEYPQREVQPVTLRKSTATDANDPNVRLLVVPVDLRALENQAISNTLVTQHDIDNLEKYDEQYAKQKGQTRPSSRPPSPYSMRFPPFPIYGNVSAGPNGEAILLTPDGFSEGIDDKSVLINNLKYLVDFTASPVPDFLHNKKYGWLKVTGESMNKATPIPLLPNDFVLFCENRSLEACVQKIVIALVADMESQPPRPMVKWLLKMSGKVPCGADGYSPEECKFLLRSQSSLVKDPITGKNFTKDIEIENDYQLVGEVIAVAKRQ